MATRIFISHSTALTDLDTDVIPVYDALKDAGFDVLLDRKRLESGQWIRQLYAWIGLCQGAVILLSKRAAEPERFWVAREASLLMWRKALDPRFEVIPVLRHGATPEDFDSGNFRDLGLRSLLNPDQDTPEAIVDFVRTRSSLEAPSAKTPLEVVAEKLATQLEHIGEALLEERANEMNIDLGPWNPKKSSYLRFAIRLLQLSYRQAVRKLQGLGDYGDRARLANCLDLLAPLHANPEAATILPRLYERKDGRVAAAFNSTSTSTAEIYIRRAYWHADSRSLNFAQPSLETGENYDAVRRQVFQTAVEALYAGDAPGTLEELRQDLQEAEEDGQRVFILWNCSKQIPAAVFRKLQSENPLFRFFLLAGDAEAPLWLTQLETSCYRELAPPLEEGEERRITRERDRAQRMI